MMISMIVAMTPDLVIGKNGHMPWHIKSDLQRFRKITSGHHVLMGRVNYLDIGGPLPNRTNMVLTRDEKFVADGCITVSSVEGAIERAYESGETELFVIGGASTYKAAMPYADKLYLTIVCANVGGTTLFPSECWTSEWEEVAGEGGGTFATSDGCDEYDTMYCTFLKRSAVPKMNTEAVGLLDPYKPAFHDWYAKTMMNMICVNDRMV